jgi:hypothetical protein
MIVITSTGRSGTTFLIILYTLLGYNTGFNPEKINDEIRIWLCNSGMERPLWDIENDRYEVVKNPDFCTQIPHLIEKTRVDRVILPLRDYTTSAFSRSKYSRPGIKRGGFIGEVDNVDDQIRHYHKMVATLLIDCTRSEIPVVTIDFEKMVRDAEYLYKKLEPTFGDRSIDLERFRQAYKEATEYQKKVGTQF